MATATCPTARDQRIYFEVRILGTTQMWTAQLFGLTQPRVSQIVREVARWHAEQGIEPPDEALARRRRLANKEECERLRNLYELTLAELDRLREPEVERKLGRRGYVEWDEETHRPPRGRVQLLKLARNLVHDLHKIEPCVSGPAEEPDDAEAGMASEEAGVRDQEPGVRDQERGVESELVYSPAAEGAALVGEPSPVVSAEPAASIVAAESCDAASERRGSAAPEGAERKNGANINWPGDEIPQEYGPRSRMMLRAGKTNEAVAAALRS